MTRIYIPGLGDDSTIEKQRTIIARWNDTILFEPKWHTTESAETKIARLQKLYQDTPGVTEVIGSSAGGSLALLLFGQHSHKLDRLIIISGKFRQPEGIGPSFQKRAPSLLATVNKSNQVLERLTPSERAKITTYRPLLDNVIPTKTMTIKGADNKRVPAIGHAFGIGVALLFCIKK